MGTYGSGNFQNDTANGYYCDFCEELVDQIRGTIETEGSMDPDDYDSEVMFPNIEILCVLFDHIGEFFLPEPNEIKTWKEKYLQNWDQYIDQLNPKQDFKAERRNVMVATFDSLIMRSVEYHK